MYFFGKDSLLDCSSNFIDLSLIFSTLMYATVSSNIEVKKLVKSRLSCSFSYALQRVK